MSIDPTFQFSELWKRTLAPQVAGEKYETPRSRLRESFLKTRRTVAPLVEKISAQLPHLTVHDVSHLDALWTVADVILGPNYPINPAEAYVLGMAFLLHDAATSTFAYPDGVQGVRNTVEWKDYVAQRGIDEAKLISGELEYQATLFETLRLLHAKQAANLPIHSWKGIDSGERYLIEDVELRNHYGRVIGKVAASHGDDIAKVESELAFVAPISPHSSLRLDSVANWVVDPLKLAMIIRCVDAAHIDSLRAPDIQAALVSPSGESQKHWIFQNKLGSLAINEKNELYWSSSAFGVEQADAWWRCFETCQMINGEITSANRILSEQRRPTLYATGVVGALDIDIFKRNIPVEGWDPVNFNFKVSQVGDVIERFGGEKLYGNKPYLALRELIQNSADAIRARRSFTEDMSRGKIEISLRLENNGNWWLDIQDDGIGMSRYVITDVLLDFGRSLWKDPALRRQWSGLASKGFGAVGQFGIGFFSVFMLGDEVKVTSWRYGSGMDQQLTLHLRNRVQERPLLIETQPKERLHEPGTKISVRLANGRSSLLRKIYIKSSVSPGMVQELEPLERLVGSLAPALDIDLWCRDGSSMPKIVVEANDWGKIPGQELLRRLALNINEKAVDKYGDLLTNLSDENDKIIGRAAVYAGGRRYYNDEYGVLVHKGIVSGHCSGMVGVLEASNSSDLARMDAVPVANAVAMKKWARGQLELRPSSTPQISERLISLGIAKSDLIVGRMSGRYVSVADLIDMLNEAPLEEIICVTTELQCPEDISQNEFENREYRANILDLTECSPEERYDFGLGEWLREIYSIEESTPSTILELIRYFLQNEFNTLEQYEGLREVAETESTIFEETCEIFKRG